MATKKKRKEMVFQKDCTNVSTKATRPPRPPSLVLLKPLRAAEGGTIFTDKVEDRMKKPSAGGSSPTKTILENLPAKICCHGVSVTLDNNVMWNEFFRCQTEMILTQDGSRMFPYCRFRISGLDASKKYSLVVDIQPVDSSQYEWTGHNWQVAGKAIRHLKSLPFSHPDSPSTGQHWMEQPVSFYKLKLTNMVPGQGNLVLHPLHRYIPRLHVVPFSSNAKKEPKLNGPRVATFTFPQTEFFAVTAYQNSRFTQLKVNYNPFAKGFKDERSSSLALKLTSSARKDLNNEADPSNNQNPLVKKSLKSLLANHKPRSSPVADHQHSDTLIPAATSSNEELSSKAKPSQKLFSELIREAHVSLRRCNLDKMVASMKSTCKVKVAEFERPVQTVCTAVNEKSTTASCPAPKSPTKLFLSSLDSKSKSETQPEKNVRLHKRPALVPLPALARFLSKHQPKNRNVGTRQEPLNSPPSEAPPPSKAVPGVRSTVGSHSGSYCISPASTLHHQEPTQEGQVLTPQIVVPEPKVPDGTLVLPSTDLQSSISEQIHFSTSAPEGLPTAIDEFLADITNSSTVAPLVSTNQPAPLLPDSSPIGFESLSPASSPEPLPPLHVSLGLETLPSPSVVHTTLKWHSLFPQPDPFLTSFTPFYPTTQSPTQIPPDQPCQESPSVTHYPLLHEDEYHSLPFPGELSPLALQLSLSPSFSSLDGGALSPSPSLSDLLSFISTDNNNLLLEAEVGKAEHVLVPCPLLPLTVPITRPDPCPPVESEPKPTTKPLKGKKKCRKGKSKGATSDSDPMYIKMQPSLEEVEEQLFVSFTSKEALKLHLQDSHEGPGTQPLESSREDPQPTTPPPEGEAPKQSTPPPDTAGIGASATGEHVSPGEELKDHKESVAVVQKILLRDLKHMKNRQVIHPVLQEVGLKMHLLDSALAIDLQYLGVRLPIPPHPISLEAQAPPPRAASPQTPPRLLPQSVSLDFVSRTGKTSDITQIKGWRDKFSPSESSTSPSSSRPEAAAPSEHPGKNLSAFCSDMLDEYLENEGKFLDQHASSFSQAPPEPVAYELPTQSSSYVRTLSSVLKKQPLSAPTSALISSFVPPSKRPRLPPTTTKKSKADRRQKTAGSKLKSKPASGTGDSAPTNSSLALVSPTAAGPEQPLTQTSTLATSPAQLATPSTHPSLTSQTQDKSEADQPPAKTIPPLVSTPNDRTSKKAKKLKAAPSLSPTPKTPAAKDLASGCQDLAPLESDSELGPAGDEAPSRPPQPKALVSVTLLKQRDLEDGVVWEGRPRTCITEERASIALTSLFTSAGFVREDPTAPIQLVKRPTPACLKDFCLLGCICSSLAHSRPIIHCGKAQCMLGCSCLRQKVVLLKNLDGSDSSPSDLDPSKRKRKKRMKMAYVLKETESVAQPAQPVRTLWKGGDVDPEPLFSPNQFTLRRNQVRRVAGNNGKTCARVRGYTGRKTLNHERKSGVQEAEEEPRQIRNKTAASTTDLSRPKSPESRPDLAKHLVIVADCRWPSPEVQTQVLKAVCQAMAQDRLHKPFWINKYYAKLLSFNIKHGVVQYKVHISEGKADLPKTLLSTTRPGPIGPSKTGPTGTGGEEVQGEEAVEYWQKEVQGEEAEEDSQKEVQGEEAEEDSQKEVQGEEPREDSQKEVQGEDALEYWQKEVEGEEAEEDSQKEVEEEEAEEDSQKEVQGEEAEEDSQKEVQEDKEDLKEVKKRMMKMALPFLSGLSHVGFLTANRKESGGGNLLVEVNGKPYPMAMVQLGRMGALHPANRLAAYLTGRVGPSQPPAPPASSTALVTMATTPPTSDQKSPGEGSNGGRTTTGQFYFYDTVGHLSQRMERRLIRLVPLSQVRDLMVPDGKPRTHKDSKSIVGDATGPMKVVPALSVAPRPAGPAPAAGTCKLRLVSANHQSNMPIIVTVPMTYPTTPAGSSGTDQNIRPAASSGTDPNSRPAACSGTDQNIREIASSGMDLNIICVDNEPDILTNEEHVGVARTFSSENASLGVLQRPEHDVVVLLSSDLSDSSSESELENGPGRGSMQSSRNSQHCLLEKERRKAIAEGLSRLQREIGLRDKTPKVTILKQAHEEVLELRSSECSLARQKGSLRRQRGERIRTLALKTGKSEESISRELLQLSNGNTQQGQTGSNPPLAAEVVAQLDETDEQTENSSDEENLSSDTQINIFSILSDDDIEIETVLDNSSMTVDDRKGLVTAFKSLRSELNSKTRTRIQLLAQACSVICDLKDQEKHCEKKMVALKRQRSQLINKISARSGRSTKTILEKLQSITTKQRQLEETRSKARPAEGSTPLDLTSTTKLPSQPPAPPPAPPRAPPPAPPPAPRRAPPPAPQMGLPLPPPTGSPHNASRLKTVPNILARRKPPSPPSAPSLPPPAGRSESGEAAAPPVHTAVMPAGLVSFLCPLPGQQVLTLKPMASEPGSLPPNPGVASVSLDISYPAKENIPHLCLPRPSTSTGPFPTLLYLLPSTTALQPQEQPTQQLGSLPLHQTIPAGSLPHHQTIPAGSLPHHQTIPAGSLPHHQTIPAGSLPLHQTIAAGSLPQQTLLSAGSLPQQTLLSAGSLPQQTLLSAGSLPQQTLLSGVPGFKLEACAPRAQSPVLPATAPAPEPRPGLLLPEEGTGLSSLVNQLSFLNQNHGPPADRTLLSSVPGPPCSSLVREPRKDGPLEPSLSNEDLTEATQVNGHMQSTEGPEPNVCNALHYPQCSSMGGTLTLPPLLQMKVGGANVSESTNERAVGAWKPMPRLAAMGVKGGPPI